MSLPIIATPKYNLTVPSTGEQVEYRPYLVKEEKVLMMAMESQDQKQIVNALVETIKSCTDNKVDASKLATFDLEYIFLQLRAKSVGESSKLKMKCKECEEFNEVSIDLAGIEPPTVDSKRRIVKLTDDLSIQLKFPSVKDTASMATDGSQTDMIFDAVIASIDVIYYQDETLDAKDHSKKELMEFIESLSSSQFAELGAAITDSPALKANVSFTCQSCGADNDIEVKGLQNFF